MQKRKFDELISHFNRKVSDMSIDQKYKMELLGMISAIGFAHEKELSTNLASLGTDCISRQAAIDAFNTSIDELVISGKENADAVGRYLNRVIDEIKQLPTIQPKRGRWHYSDGKPARIGLSFGVVCDQCGTESEYCTNFCGECGADMRTAEQIVHDAIDNTPMAEDAYPGIKERLHKAVDDMREVNHESN